jgi:hypothetical protein
MGKGIALIQDMGHRLVSAALIASQMQPFGSMQLPTSGFNPATVTAQRRHRAGRKWGRTRLSGCSNTPALFIDIDNILYNVSVNLARIIGGRP